MTPCLLELRHVRQIPDDYRRRIFADRNLNLVVWYRPDGAIHGFQLSYDPSRNPRALTWLADRGFSHAAIDGGEESPLANRTPILRPSCDLDTDALLASFLAVSQNLPGPEREFVARKLQGCLPQSRARRWLLPALALPFGFMTGLSFFVTLVRVAQGRHDRHSL